MIIIISRKRIAKNTMLASATPEPVTPAQRSIMGIFPLIIPWTKMIKLMDELCRYLHHTLTQYTCIAHWGWPIHCDTSGVYTFISLAIDLFPRRYMYKIK